MHRILYIFLLLLLTLPLQLHAQTTLEQKPPKVLIFNSYHKGYSWSDQILTGIESTILHGYPEADIRVEYMDTKRNNSEQYLEQIFSFYWEKYNNRQEFDLIFASDDNAIHFLLKWAEYIFPETPVIFCGANSIDTKRLQQLKNFTGIMEYADIERTIDIALQLQPDAKKLVVINDTTITGRNIGEEFNRLVPDLSSKLEITVLPDQPLHQLAETVSHLDKQTIILLLAYLRDSIGTYYDPETTAKTLSTAAPVPIYSVWDFYFNHGITGGVLTSGYLQGEAAAEVGMKVFEGEYPDQIPVDRNGANILLYDYRQLQRFNLSVENIPRDSVVKNITYGDQKNVLFLHSYSNENLWTRAIIRGIEETFINQGLAPNTFTEFMDTKRYTDKPYLHALAQMLQRKYAQTNLDLIVVSDDNAYNFVLNQRSLLFGTTPVLFCGVNYLSNPQEVTAQNITGVIETYDILGTLQLGLQLLPETEKIFIINDDTTTGKANIQRLQEILPKLPKTISLEYSELTSMHELQQKVAALDPKTIVLLMSFTKDKDNYRFSFEESARMISEKSSRPVFGFWDFYLGNGIIGGVITSGYDQGKTVAALAVQILRGESISKIPVVERNPVSPTLDYNVLRRFNISSQNIPASVQILNEPQSFLKQYKKLTYTIFTIIILLVALISLQTIKIILQKRTHRRLARLAETDPLTGAKNREYLQRTLNNSIKAAVTNSSPLSLCYIDLDNLKFINDTRGHNAGDSYILLVVNSIRKHVRLDDVICRVGGDEFIILLPNCEKEKALNVCRQVNEDIQARDILPECSLGISSGISWFNHTAPVTASELINQADSRMYRDKMARKSRSK
jgi:diguanylate cyclase (GGDEF)-like protein